MFRVNLIIILFYNLGYSQNYQQMLNTHSEWHLTSCNNGCITDVYYIDGDTSFNNYNYKILNGFHYISKTFWIRENIQEQKIYMSYENPGFERREVLLYDFSLELGDTITLTNPISPFSTNPGDFSVDSIEFILLNNNYHKKITLSSIDNTISESPIWIEGIGSLSMINAPGGTPNINGAGKLSCYFKNNTLIYFQLDSISSCNSIITNLNETLSDNTTTKKIIKITDILLRDVHFKKNKMLLYFYSDGTIEKKYVKY